MSEPIPPPALKECGNCGSQRRWILHHVRIRGIHRRLCSSCVLRLHPSSFCPSCFQFYDSASVPPLSKRLTCSKCSSFTHSHCASTTTTAAAAAASPGGYLCSSCSLPAGAALFDVEAGSGRPIDRRMALVLLCAAKISASSMDKAVVVARAEAERRVREAAYARKRAREAIENLAVVSDGGGGGGAAAASGSGRRVVNPPPASAANGSPASAAAARRGENGRAAAANGNAKEKDRSGSVEVKMERMEIEQAPLK